MTDQAPDVVVRRDVPGFLVVERKLFTVGRGLLAAILLGWAIYLATSQLRAWRYFTNAASAEEWRQAYPGFALVAVVVVTLAALAWVLLLRRRSLVLDLTARHLTTVRDDRIDTRRQRYLFADVQSVVVTRRSRKARVTFPVALMMRDGGRVVASDAPEKAPAKRTVALIASAQQRWCATPTLRRCH